MDLRNYFSRKRTLDQSPNSSDEESARECCTTFESSSESSSYKGMPELSCAALHYLNLVSIPCLKVRGKKHPELDLATGSQISLGAL